MKYLKPEWFRRRRFGGWGIVPVTWQGYAFIIALIAPFILITSSFDSTMQLNDVRYVSFGLYTAFVISISMCIMVKIKIDEREKIHEAISDRNALWFMIFILALGAVGESVAPNIVRSLYPINPFIIGGLVGAWIVKVISLLYLDRKD